MGRDEQRSWLSTAEIADELEVSSETIRRWIRERRMAATALAVGDRVTYRVTREAYEAFRREHLRDTLHDDWE